MRHIPLFLSAAIFSLAPAFAHAVEAVPAPALKTFSDSERAAIEDVVKEYLTKKNPEVMLEVMQELQKRQTAEADTKSKAALGAEHDKIFKDPDTPVGGNPKGDVAVVEFFDYQCGYCKMSEPTVARLLKEDKNVKFIYKDFPILGPVSTQAAKASLASVRQNKYEKFHAAMMGQKEHLTEDMIYKTAKETGLDVDKLKKDMADEAINKIVEANVTLGTAIGVRGTPMFIIGDQVFPGAMQYDQMKKAVDDARAAAKKP